MVVSEASRFFLRTYFLQFDSSLLLCGIAVPYHSMSSTTMQIFPPMSLQNDVVTDILFVFSIFLKEYCTSYLFRFLFS